MNKLLTMVVALVILVVLGYTMATYTVRYDETAVRTRFGKVLGGGASLVTQPGLYLRWPSPVDEVRKYPKTLQHVRHEPREIQTRDGFAITVRSFVTYRVTDPLRFFVSVEEQTLGSFEDRKLRPAMDEIKSVIALREFAQLVNPDPEKVELDALEAECLAQLQQRVAAGDYGVEIVSFGVERLLFPQEITQDVTNRMVAVREALASNIRSEGETRAQNVRTRAEQIASRIQEFAKRRADAIVAEGEETANERLKVFDENPKLAAFLLQVETLKSVLTRGTTTYILGPEQWEALRLLAPSAGADASGGE
ncbi:MAG: SPFH domain-containing protein [Planctomycetota bacterium]